MYLKNSQYNGTYTVSDFGMIIIHGHMLDAIETTKQFIVKLRFIFRVFQHNVPLGGHVCCAYVYDCDNFCGESSIIPVANSWLAYIYTVYT